MTKLLLIKPSAKGIKSPINGRKLKNASQGPKRLMCLWVVRSCRWVMCRYFSIHSNRPKRPRAYPLKPPKVLPIDAVQRQSQGFKPKLCRAIKVASDPKGMIVAAKKLWANKVIRP